MAEGGLQVEDQGSSSSGSGSRLPCSGDFFPSWGYSGHAAPTRPLAGIVPTRPPACLSSEFTSSRSRADFPAQVPMTASGIRHSWEDLVGLPCPPTGEWATPVWPGVFGVPGQQGSCSPLRTWYWGHAGLSTLSPGTGHQRCPPLQGGQHSTAPLGVPVPGQAPPPPHRQLLRRWAQRRKCTAAPPGPPLSWVSPLPPPHLLGLGTGCSSAGTSVSPLTPPSGARASRPHPPYLGDS